MIMRKLLILFVLLSNCSFDNKTGIWTNENQVTSKQEDKYKEFEDINLKTKIFNELIEKPMNLEIPLNPVFKVFRWNDEYFNNSNNFLNFSYNNLNQEILKSKKITRHETKDKILYLENNVILTDIKGNILVYSTASKDIIYKYNFYKKKYKNIKKIISIKVENNIIYASDNIGFIYALDYVDRKLLWAKNYNVPFRSNLKIFKDKLILANQDNKLFFINKINGNRVKVIPTEQEILKNNFFNSLALKGDSLLFLNNYGSLYSINANNERINWFLNLNQSISSRSNNLFFSNPIVIYKNKLIISSDPNLYILDYNTGIVEYKNTISSIVKPIVTKENIFFITKNNLLICFDLIKKKVVYSIDISQMVAEYYETKKKSINIKSAAILNNDLYIFLKNSYFIQFNVLGKIEDIHKFKSKINSEPIFVNDSIIYLDKKNKLIIVN